MAEIVGFWGARTPPPNKRCRWKIRAFVVKLTTVKRVEISPRNRSGKEFSDNLRGAHFARR